MDDRRKACRESLSRHSRSFWLASLLLSPRCHEDAAAVYAWCRRADDAIDEPGGEDPRDALVRLRAELRAIYAGVPTTDPVLGAFQEVARRRHIPPEYPFELLDGMEMDISGHEYHHWQDTLLYCYRVASTVGLMMCHVLGVSDPRALRHAADLGVAMQLTNICRDVREDWGRGRMYLPSTALARHGGAAERPRSALGLEVLGEEALASTVKHALDQADRYYASGRLGLRYLSLRCALSVDLARRVYAAIGSRIRARKCSVMLPRAFVPPWQKAWCFLLSLLSASWRGLRGQHRAEPTDDLPLFGKNVRPIAT